MLSGVLLVLAASLYNLGTQASSNVAALDDQADWNTDTDTDTGTDTDPDAYPEVMCAGDALGWKWPCNNGSCIPIEDKCDGYVNCFPSGEDEVDCDSIDVTCTGGWMPLHTAVFCGAPIAAF